MTRAARANCISILVKQLQAKAASPKLKLNGALLLAELVQLVRSMFQLNEAFVYVWFDATIALAWIEQETSQLESYVANQQVARIRKLGEQS